MLNHIVGEVFSLLNQHLVVDVHGMGLNILITKRLQSEIHGSDSNKVFLYTRMMVREGDISLFGFFDDQERKVFDHLIQVQGVGAKTALLILSEYTSDELLQVVMTKNIKGLNQIKGIGRKIAERIILELKDKVEKIWSSEQRAMDSDTDKKQLDDHLFQQAVHALIGLGCSESTGSRAIQKAMEGMQKPFTLEALIKEGLKHYRER